MVEHLPRGICAIYLVSFKLVTNGTVKVALATRHNFRLSASVFVFAGDGSPTHLRHVTDIT